jgi:signal transduction histidine kinase
VRAPDILRTPAFRIAGVSVAILLIGILLLFAFIYWQTATYETGEMDRFLERQVGAMAESDPVSLVNSITQRQPASGTAYAALFDAARQPVAGNLTSFPADLAIDGRAHAASLGLGQQVRAAAATLPDGRILVIARDVGELSQLQQVVLRALFLGVVPAIVLALAAGALLSWRALGRVRTVQQTVARILDGNLRERLPTQGTGDDLDRLATAVNRMLDEIVRLLDEIKGVGDNIAHDLRTPLTRMRARLERGRDSGRTREDLEETVGKAIGALDQALGIITALLRITELEDSRRRAAFRDVELTRIVHDVAELYEPIAEAAQIKLAMEANQERVVQGDRELLFEAVANIVDNAIKFAPPHSTVQIAIVDGKAGPIVRVVDNGPGIPPDQRQAVLKRFYRGDKSRHLPGSGLGLGIVNAIVNLHHFRIAIGDAAPGCVFDLICAPAPKEASVC